MLIIILQIIERFRHDLYQELGINQVIGWGNQAVLGILWCFSM